MKGVLLSIPHPHPPLQSVCLRARLCVLVGVEERVGNAPI